MDIEPIDIERRLEQFMAAARKAGVKLTHQRLEIFREIASSLEHPDAVTVFRAVQARMPTVSLDTVYRTLWTLSDLGLITTLGSRRESVRFDANLEPHHHYVCVRCGLARDFVSAELDTLHIPDTVRSIGSIVATRVEVRGVCESCSMDQARKPATRDSHGPRDE
jgi:Fur family transcriptional regulator, peroxide stress response regulator